MTDSQIATTKCFSSILRRLLCTGSLPTHPSDHITESNTTEFEHLKKDLKTTSKVEASATTPGIVARLMGLESLPIPKGTTLDSIARSRSVNSIDYLMEFDPLQAKLHRRVRTSVSFREVPTCLHQQNHDLFVLCFGNVDETKEMGSKPRKTEVGFGELKQKKAERSKKKENVREKVHVKKKENVENKKKAFKGKDERRSNVYGKQCSKVGNCSGAKDLGFVLPARATSKAKNPLKPVNQEKVLVGSKLTNKKKSQVRSSIKKVELECNSENSNPVSVLDLQDFSIHHESPLSEDSRPMVLNSGRKSSPKTANYDYPSPHITRKSNTNGLELGAIKNKDYESVKTRETEYYIELLGEICRLTEKDIKGSKWIAKEVCRLEDFEEICMEFGQNILDLLLHQVVDDLAACHMTSFEL